MTVVLVFLTLFVISIFLLIYGALVDIDWQLFVGLILFLVSGMVFGITSTEKDVSSEWVVKKVSVMRTPRLVAVDDGNKIWEFKSYEDVMNINDSTQFEFEHTTNFWGGNRIEGIRIKK